MTNKQILQAAKNEYNISKDKLSGMSFGDWLFKQQLRGLYWQLPAAVSAD